MVNDKVPTAYSMAILVGFIKDLGFRRIKMKCDNEPGTKSLQDAVVRACAGVEVIRQGPLEGESHGQRSCGNVFARSGKTMQNSSLLHTKRNTSVRIADDSPPLFHVLHLKS